MFIVTGRKTLTNLHKNTQARYLLLASTILSNKVVRSALIALPVFLALSFSYFRVFEPYELQTYDWRCQLRLPRPMSKDIVIIEISEDTLQNLGQWPIDRENYAVLINILNKYKAKSVFFDVLFAEARDNDVLVETAAKSNGNVFFPVVLKEPKRVQGVFESDDNITPLLESYKKASKSVPSVNMVVDMDGKRRRVIPFVSQKGEGHYHLGVLAAMDALGLQEKDIVHQKQAIQLGKDLTVPLDEDGYFLVSYAMRWSKDLFEHYSFYDVIVSPTQISMGIKPNVDLRDLKGKICVVGGTATATMDVNATPVDHISPNVGIHANVLNTILQKDFIRRLDRWQNLLILLFLAAGVFYASLRMRPVAAFRTMILSVGCFVTFVVFIFIRFGIWMDLFYPFALCIVIYAITTLGRTLYEMKKRELIESELKVASQIQKSFLPQAVPVHPGLELAVYMKPAKAVGGDLYAFIPLTDDKIGVMLGDVSGKGTPAALFMAKAVSEFKFSAREQTDPGEVLTKLNDSIASESTGGLFVTLAYVIFDTKGKRLSMSNGGHLPMICVEPDGRSEQLSGDGGMPIGVMDGIPFMKFEKGIRAGEYYALYSDGVSEARNRKKEEFGIETLQKIMQDNKGMNAQKLLEKAIERLNQFMGKADQHDDITLLIVRINPDHGIK